MNRTRTRLWVGLSAVSLVAAGLAGFAASASASENAPKDTQKCVASGSWTTEDTAPVQQADGLLFAGPSVPAVDWYHPLSGNLQGIVPSTITYSAVSGYHASLVFEIFRTGTTGYATINAEPYLNGWSAGETGTFTVDQSTLVWTSKIASGPGSQSSPITLAAMGALYPTNTLISEGIHLGSNSTSEQSSLVTSVGGCVTDNFVPVVVTTVTPVNPTVTQSMCVAGKATKATVTAAKTAGITYVVGSDLTSVTAYPSKGYVLGSAAGWVPFHDGTATLQVHLTSAGTCAVAVVPVAIESGL